MSLSANGLLLIVKPYSLLCCFRHWLTVNAFIYNT